MGPRRTKLTYLLWNSKVWRQSPPWERSRPCRRGFWTHPSRPRPLGGRSVGRERWGPRCKVCGLALCVRCERRARPRCCRHTATPDQTRQRERRKVTHPHQYTWEIRLWFCFISFPPLTRHSFPLSLLPGCRLSVGWGGRAAVAFVACRDGEIYRLNHSCSCLYHLCSLVWRESSCRNRLTSRWPGVWASVHDD